MSSFDGLVESLRNVCRVPPSESSRGLGWVGLQAFRYRKAPTSEIRVPPLAQHALILFNRPPEKLDLRYEGVKRDRPPSAGSIAVVPANSGALWSWRGNMDLFHVYLEPSLIARAAAESFQFNSWRTLVPPLDSLNVPEIRAAMLALEAELRAGGVGGPLMVESLANVLSVHLIRHVSGSREPAGSAKGLLPRRKLQTVVEYIVENLESSPTLQQMAAVAHLSPYHFARQFKATTGLPPYQYVIARRVELAQQLLRKDDDICLAEVALRVGFSDQSQFSLHFKRVVGVTPGQFRMSARIA